MPFLTHAGLICSNKDAPRVLAAALMILLVPLEDVRVEAAGDHLDGVGDGSIWVTNVIT